MNRRQLIKHIALLTGAAVAGSELFLAGCKNEDKAAGTVFSEKDISFFDEVAETILPRTNTPGAKDAETGKFMASFSVDCYDEKQLKSLKDGINTLNEAAKQKYGNDFTQINPSQREELLKSIDAEAKAYNNKPGKDQPPHYFTLVKQMVLLGFFTSQPGATKVLRYIPVPGRYLGCVDYKEGETSWV
ncbi:MAG TPA: gluconate 2-dehydrogenase subunit 3 family protein [Chitinophagaceae bacterium]|nr:gluconate 2-dehydrogenase subunit 3 family protein [Chitinophagaceae bacterium]